MRDKPRLIIYFKKVQSLKAPNNKKQRRKERRGRERGGGKEEQEEIPTQP